MHLNAVSPVREKAINSVCLKLSYSEGNFQCFPCVRAQNIAQNVSPSSVFGITVLRSELWLWFPSQLSVPPVHDPHLAPWLLLGHAENK
jgi:hypothetical protein